MNRENLQKLVDFIPTIPDEQFNMNTYREGDRTTHTCGSIGCILGHATALDTPENINEYKSNDGEIEFRKWSEDYFGLYDEGWDFLFDCWWYNANNTKEGAVARVQWLLDGKEIPIDCYEIDTDNPFYSPKDNNNE